MPPTFTAIFAEHLARASGRPVHEARAWRAGPCRPDLCRAGRRVTCGSIRQDGEPHIALDDGALVNFCKPAVDPLFSLGGRGVGQLAIWRSS